MKKYDKDINTTHVSYMSTILTSSNRNRELNRVFDCQFTGPLEQFWLGIYNFDNFVFSYMKKLDKYDDEVNLSNFEYWCFSHIASYNMGLKMQKLGFNFDWSNCNRDQTYFKYQNSITDTRLEIFEFKNMYGNQELMIDFSEFHDINTCLKYNNQKTKINYIYICPIYQFIKWIIDNNKINIIDKGEYIMFYNSQLDHVHLERDENNDFEWTDFRKVVNRIFEIV